MRKHSMIFCACLLFFIYSDAQLDVNGEIWKLKQAYGSKSHLTFQFRYTYADALTPQVIDDSLSGQYRAYDGMSWSMIDSVEFLHIRRHAITLYHEDKTIFVAAPANGTEPETLSMVDSLIRSVGGINSTKSVRGHLHFDIPEQTGYQSIDILYDPGSGLISKMEMKMRRTYYPDDREASARLSDWVIVAVDFLNYSRESFDIKLFDEGRFIKLQDKEYLPVSPYEGYTVLLANPNLLN